MNELAIAVAIVLFPGLIATAIADKITSHCQKWDSFKYGIYSFIFGVACYVALEVLVRFLNYLPNCLTPDSLVNSLSVWQFVNPPTTRINPSEVIFATAISPFIAFAAAFLVNHKVFNEIARRFRVSNKYGDENLFSFYLNAKEIDWVYVRDPKNKLTYEGRVVSYSETDTIQEIVLSDVSVYAYHDSTKLYDIPSIYLANAIGIFIIEAVPQNFLENENDTKENA